MKNVFLKHYTFVSEEDSELNTLDTYYFKQEIRGNVYNQTTELQQKNYGEDIYKVCNIYLNKYIFSLSDIKQKDGIIIDDKKYIVKNILEYTKHVILEVFEDEFEIYTEKR